MIRPQGLVTLSLGASDRKDSWWVGPLMTALVLGGFTVYALWVALQGVGPGFHKFGPYLSPFYSTFINPEWVPDWLAWLSPAFLVLWIPGGLRATCYYYRKAYYRAFFFDPPACAVGEGKGTGYRGERAFPFILQNLHRFFLYIAIFFWAINAKDVVEAFIWDGQFGIGVGSLVMLVNATLLGLYTFSCHSFRHLIGGKHDCFSCLAFGKQRHAAWRGISWLTGRHMLWAWISLFSVALTDLYIRLCAMNVITDIRIF